MRPWNYTPILQPIPEIDGLTDGDDYLIVDPQKPSVEVRWVFQVSYFLEESGNTQFYAALAYDREGVFYGLLASTAGSREVRVMKDGKSALAWFASHASWDNAFTRELVRAVRQPEFEFMPLVKVRKKKPAPKKEKAVVALNQRQLLLATALVQVVRTLRSTPDVETLSMARRTCSELHQALHSEATFRAVANG